MEQLIHTYYNQVLQNADCCIYSSHASEETKDIKNDDGTYKSDAFKKFATPFLNMLPPPYNPLLLATAFSIICVVAGKNHKHDPPIYLHPLPESVAWSNSWITLWKGT